MEVESLWERIKQGLREGATTAAEKAEYLGKLGRARLDIARTRHAIHEAFSELGGQVYTHLEGDGETDVAQQENVQDQISKIKPLEAQLKDQEAQLQELQATPDGAETESTE